MNVELHWRPCRDADCQDPACGFYVEADSLADFEAGVPTAHTWTVDETRDALGEEGVQVVGGPLAPESPTDARVRSRVAFLVAGLEVRLRMEDHGKVACGMAGELRALDLLVDLPSLLRRTGDEDLLDRTSVVLVAWKELA